MRIRCNASLQRLLSQSMWQMPQSTDLFLFSDAECVALRKDYQTPWFRPGVQPAHVAAHVELFVFHAFIPGQCTRCAPS